MCIPNIIISKCINIAPVRYDGKINHNKFCKLLSKYVHIVPVCPEVSIGLGVPRAPIFLVKKGDRLKIINSSTGEDIYPQIIKFSNKFLKTLTDIDGFILKSKSPSCGVSGTKVYRNENKTGFLFRKRGVFAQQVLKKFPHLPIEDESRLENPYRRHHFLIRIFALAEIKNTCQRLDIFYKKYYFIIKSYGQKKLKHLHQYTRNNDRIAYRRMFLYLLTQLPHKKSVVNTWNEIYDILSLYLDKKRKKEFKSIIVKIINKIITPQEAIKKAQNIYSSIPYRDIRLNKFFFPYPQELLNY